MKEKFALKDLAESLRNTHIKMNLTFLNRTLIQASKSRSPHRNESFCKQIGCPINPHKKSATTVYGWMKGYRTIPLSKLIKIRELSNSSWEEIEKNLSSIKAGIRKGEIFPKFPISVGYEPGSIVGHIMGDGSIEKRFHSVFYSNSNPDLLREFSRYMEKIFGIKPRIWAQDKPDYGKTKWLKKISSFEELPRGNNAGLFYPKICSDILYAILGKFAEGKNKKITVQMKGSNSEFKKGFIRAFFDDEGSVNSKNYTVRFHQDRKKILEDIRIMLKEINIRSNPIRKYQKSDKNRYYFNITGFKEYSKFYEVIGCTSNKKKKEFEVLINKRNKK